MMKIIGHRGAAGLALENTLPSIELARLLGVDAIEFDVRKTKDGHLVLCHDADLSHVSSSNAKIANLTLKKLGTITLNDGQSKVPTLEEALHMTEATPVIIELKESGCIDTLLAVLEKFHTKQLVVASFKHQEAIQLKKIRPDLTVYLAENSKVLDAIHLAHQTKLDGLDINFWLLNPLVYWLAKRYKLQIMVYTINNRMLTRFINILYPQVAICTNHPEWFIKHPWLKLRQHSKNVNHIPSKQKQSQKLHQKK